MKRVTPKAVIDALIERYRPSDAEIEWRTDGKWRPAHANQLKNGKIHIRSPYPDTPFKALVFLHECAHVASGVFYVDTTPCHDDEFRAEILAMAWWRSEGFCVPREYTSEAKRYIRECITYDRRKGIKIKAHIARWARK